MNSLREHKGTGKNYGLKVVFAVALFSFIMSYIQTPDLQQIVMGLKNILFAHHRIDTDLFVVAGSFGGAWANAGLIVLMMGLTYLIFGTEVKGLELAAMGQIFGYSFYAQSPFNVFFPFIGCMLEAKVNKKDLGGTVATAWFSTALAPFVSTFAFHVKPFGDSVATLIFSIVLGILLGYLVGIMAGYMKTLHNGRLLFNMGLTTGVVGWIFYNVLKAMGFEQTPVADMTYIEGFNKEIWLAFALINVLFLAFGIYYDKGIKKYKDNLFMNRTFGGDYTQEFGIGTALINMGVVGTLALTYPLLTPYGQLNGPVIGGIFTVAGFAANGLTIRGILPVWLGIYGGSLLMGGIKGMFMGETFIAGALEKVSSRAMLVAAMHGTGTTPLSEKDGWKSATVAAMMHTMNTVNTGWLHGWMQSYNNGFSQGLIIILFKPVWYFFSKERKKNEFY